MATDGTYFDAGVTYAPAQTPVYDRVFTPPATVSAPNNYVVPVYNSLPASVPVTPVSFNAPTAPSFTVSSNQYLTPSGPSALSQYAQRYSAVSNVTLANRWPGDNFRSDLGGSFVKSSEPVSSFDASSWIKNPSNYDPLSKTLLSPAKDLSEKQLSEVRNVIRSSSLSDVRTLAPSGPPALSQYAQRYSAPGIAKEVPEKVAGSAPSLIKDTLASSAPVVRKMATTYSGSVTSPVPPKSFKGSELEESLSTIISTKHPELSSYEVSQSAELANRLAYANGVASGSIAKASPEASEKVSNASLRASDLITKVRGIDTTKLNDPYSSDLEGRRTFLDSRIRREQGILNDPEAPKESIREASYKLEGLESEVIQLERDIASAKSKVVGEVVKFGGLASTEVFGEKGKFGKTTWNLGMVTALGGLGVGLASIWMQKMKDDNDWDKQMELARLQRQWAREDSDYALQQQIAYNAAVQESDSGSSSMSVPSAGGSSYVGKM